jgi:predicted membrane chloride channel (bestrophin family)
MYPIPKEINSEIKITRLFYLSDIIFMSVVVVISLMFSSYIHNSFSIPYFIFCFLVGLFLSFPVRSNAGKRRWESYLYWLLGDRKWYGAIVESEVKQIAENETDKKIEAEKVRL